MRLFSAPPGAYPTLPRSFTRPTPLTTPLNPLRSFQGFTCLIQISSRSHDYVVDAIVLRAFLGPALCPLLADPSRVKVLHGADRDVEWLQVCVGGKNWRGCWPGGSDCTTGGPHDPQAGEGGGDEDSLARVAIDNITSVWIY